MLCHFCSSEKREWDSGVAANLMEGVEIAGRCRKCRKKIWKCAFFTCIRATDANLTTKMSDTTMERYANIGSWVSETAIP